MDDSVAADPGVCPLCQDTNHCAVRGGAQRCWCFTAKIDGDLVMWLAARGHDGACLCRICAAGYVPSPCIGVCALNTDGTTCVGCERTSQEIATWGRMTSIERAEVLMRVRGPRRPAAPGAD